jgi:hypothetical protein
MDTPESEEAKSSPLELGCTVAPKVNLALQQNAVPVIRDLYLANNADQNFESLLLRVEAQPAFCIPREWTVDRLLAQTQFRLSDIKLDLSHAFLADLSEAVLGQLIFSLRDSDGNEWLSLREPIEVLARDEWGGTGDLPEIISAFVQPNDAAVETILSDAAKRLRAATLDASFDGYQSGNPQRVAKVVSAIWSAICGLNIAYAVPPASFEKIGQKIRSPSRILDKRLGTCLDMCVLFASCLEQAGLHSLIIFTEGHAFAGCWLNDEDFSHSVVDDPQSLRKRVQLGELLVFETTLATHAPPAKFSFACQEGQSKLENEDAFNLAVDIKRTRMGRIRPLSMSTAEGAALAGSTIEAPAPVELPIDIPDNLPESFDGTNAPEKSDLPAETPAARLERWKRKLLDLSLRNRLLNFKTSKRAVVLDCPDPGKLEDKLADGAAMKIQPSLDDQTGQEPRSQQLHLEQQQENLRLEQTLRALERGEIRVRQTEEKLEASLLELYRAARSAEEEGGANILFLAIGFLVWTQKNKLERKLRAPLILLPVQLTRQSVRSGFRLKSHEDEARFNPTLLQMLRQDFDLKTIPGLEGELPTDDHGLDVSSIWNMVRRAVRDIAGWEVVEDVVLSTFSFAKYLMWKDLSDRTDALKQNSLVKHLIESPREPYRGNNDAGFPDPDRLDDEHQPAQTFAPLPADGSQLAAVFAAAEGRDYVLVGPPGTGKSQTISNMIAQCLAEEKTVLFVSEKTAALDVVYRRMRQVGLSSSCLELHSSKARKMDVLHQLQSAWETQAGLDLEEWRREAQRLGRLREELNTYVQHLHRQHANGLTAYRAIGEVVANAHVPQVALSWPNPDVHSEADFARLRDIAERIDLDAAQVGGIRGNPLGSIARGDWSPSWQHSLMEAARTLLADSVNLESRAGNYLKVTALPGLGLTDNVLEGLATLHAHLVAGYGQPAAFLFADQGSARVEELRAILEPLRGFQDAWANLSCPFQRAALDLDLKDLAETWAQSGAHWWGKRWSMQRRVRKALRDVTDGRQTSEVVDRDLASLLRAQQARQAIEAFNHLAGILGRVWQGPDTPIEAVSHLIGWAEGMQATVRRLAGDPESFMALGGALANLLGGGHELLAPGGPIEQAGQAFRRAYDRFQGALEAVLKLIGAAPAGIGQVDTPQYLETIRVECDQWLAGESRLKYWCAWRTLRQQAIEHNLTPLIHAVESGVQTGVASEHLFRVNYCRWWLNAVIDRDDALRSFVPLVHQHRIDSFRDLDAKLRKLTAAYVRAKLCGQIPDKNDISRGSEWSVLSRELNKKSRHMPLRKLISNMPTTLTRLTPCVMMSPLSIAQYLPADAAPFDVVIFDEASQIPVWDAVGAIARGKQAVIVGDPKQLPPTSFFDRRDEEDLDEDVEVEDLESILDECMGANVTSLQLNWHYRSRNESLITFSNHRYYGGRLVTFPATATEDRAVRYHHVPDGIYEKGGARINQNEAKAVVATILQWLCTPTFKDTVGVVTFNTEQQVLIQNLLEQARRDYPEIEPHFAENRIEPVFVKNLESVQGDERDIILFSITYGPDIQGKVSMNFGPLNQEGGQRRLNVAISRARKAMHVYGTLRPEQIDLARTSAEGVRDFKHFLEFADRGVRALAEAVYGSIGEFDSPFESAVAEALTRKGWTVHPQVGVSAFRIDLGVVHPDEPGRYLAGVECDGATYHRSHTARDRDLLREQILRGLGWEILRVWSTDWWVDAATATTRLHEALTALHEADREKSAHIQEEQSEPEEEAEYVAIAKRAAIPADTASSEAVNLNTLDLDGSPETAISPLDSILAMYQKVDLSAFQDQLTIERFDESSHDATLRAVINQVLDTEAPIRSDVLVWRVAQAHGFGRSGSRIRNRILRFVDKSYPKTREDGQVFFWPVGSDPNDWSIYRRPGNGTCRKVDEVPRPELRVLAQSILNQGISGEQAVRTMADELGVQRIREASRSRLESVLSEIART